MTLRLLFARLASNATPRGSFSAGLYSVLYRLRDHPHCEIIPLIPSAMELEIAAQYVDYHHIHLDQTHRTVFLEKPGMRIDIGGIGKGFSAEKAAAVMRENGATGGVVAVAGDIRVFGRRADGTAWPLGIQHPPEPRKVLAMLDVTDEAISKIGRAHV